MCSFTLRFVLCRFCTIPGAEAKDLKPYPFPGGYGGEVIPDPIPNSVVKLPSADGTAQVTVWESRTPPGFIL